MNGVMDFHNGPPISLGLVAPCRAHYISDIYTGFRNKLHFTIAVKQIVDDHTVVLLSVLDPDKFCLFLRTIHRP
jgi:hypothetical protein